MSGHGGGSKGISLPLLPELEQVTSALGSAAGIFLPAPVLIIVFILLVIFFLFISPNQTVFNFQALIFTLPFWMPLVLGRFALLSFVKSKRWENHVSQKSVLLEILLPKDTLKSPAAMEAVFSGMYIGGGEGTWWKKYVQGKTRPWWSFEMAAINGQVHFYVWTLEGFRRGVEQNFYAQYPNIEIIEAEDYSRLRDPSRNDFSTLAVEYLPKFNPAYPIKTYADHGVDESTQANEYVDPLNQVFKFMSGLEPGEELWLQFVFRTSKSEHFRGEKKGKKTWKDVAKEEIKHLQTAPKGGAVTPVETAKITMIEKHLTKPGFDVGIRMIYSAPKSKPIGDIQSFVGGIFNSFSSREANSAFVAHGGSYKFSGYPWEDTKGKRRKHEELEMTEFYRARSFFHPPYRGAWTIMTSEELATLYHLPAHTLSVQSTPLNLPM